MKQHRNQPHHHHHGGSNAFIANWHASDLPLPARLKLAAGNTWIKVKHHQSCCGHPGEPGC